MRYFGVGAVVAPVLGGLPHSDAAALLVETPKVIPADVTITPGLPAEIPRFAAGLPRVEVDVWQSHPEPSHLHFEGEGFVIWADGDRMDIGTVQSGKPLWAWCPRPLDIRTEFEVTARFRAGRKV